MRSSQWSLRRKLFMAVLVMMTLLPLVVYLYSREQGRVEAAQRLTAHVERSVSRALEIVGELQPILDKAGPGSDAVREAMERVVRRDSTIAYLQLADSSARVLNSTAHAPRREAVPLEEVLQASPELAAPAVVRSIQRGPDAAPPEYLMALRLATRERGHLIVGVSTAALDEQLRQFQDPLRWPAVQITIICVAILAVFSAYIVRLHERARSLAAQLQEESRLVYIGTLAASIAHEVRNPLSSVKINVQMMEKRLGELDPAQGEYFRTKVERIKGEVERLEESVSHFLAFSRPAPAKFERARLANVLDRVLELHQPQCEDKGIQLIRRYARDVPPVELDPRQFAQAIQNLLLNAIQALPRGGAITVLTEAIPGGAALTIADNGPGIPKEIQPQIFEVFFTTREGGTGLGLNIVSRIVEEHRGRLSLESEPGRGAAFRIELPAAHPAQPNA